MHWLMITVTAVLEWLLYLSILIFLHNFFEGDSTILSKILMCLWSRMLWKFWYLLRWSMEIAVHQPEGRYWLRYLSLHNLARDIGWVWSWHRFWKCSCSCYVIWKQFGLASLRTFSYTNPGTIKSCLTPDCDIWYMSHQKKGKSLYAVFATFHYVLHAMYSTMIVHS